MIWSPAQAEMTCAPAPFDEPVKAANLVDEIDTVLSSFKSLENTLASRVDAVCIDDALYPARGYFEPETRRIVLASDLDDGLRQAVMVHELRHAEQFAQGLCPSLTLDMKNYAQAVFALEADASVTTLVVASKLRADGDASMWRALADWPMQYDITARFEDALNQSKSLPEAAHAAFDAWFEREDRTASYYVSTCLEYLDETERHHLLPQYGRLDRSFLERLCILPGGSAYPCALPR